MTDAESTSQAENDGDQAPKPKLDKEAEELQLQQFKAEARKAITEANAATLKARVYQPKSEPVKGVTTVGEKSGSLLQIVALRALEEIAEEINEDLVANTTEPISILIVENRALAETDAPHADISLRFERFAADFAAAKAKLEAPGTAERANAQAEVAALPAVLGAIELGTAALGAVGLAADLFGMFKTDYSIQGREVSINSGALVAILAGKIVGTVIVDGFSSLAGSPTFATLKDLLRQRSELEELALEREAFELAAATTTVAELTERLELAAAKHDEARLSGTAKEAQQAAKLVADLRSEREQTESPQLALRRAQVARAKTLVAAFDTYVAAISTAPEGQTYPPLVAAALRDVLHTGVEVDGETVPTQYVLYLSVTSSAGDVSTQTGLFSRNEHFRLIGAVQATYLLADRAGVVKAGGSLGGWSSARFNLDNGDFDWDAEAVSGGSADRS